MSFLAEHAAPNRRAFQGSWSSFSVVAGSLLGSGVASLLTGLLTPAAVDTWGWRLPFLAGLAIGAVGVWLRRGVAESPSFLATQKSGGLAKNPVAEVLRGDRSAMVAVLGMALLCSVPFYLGFVWLPTWLAHVNEPHLAEARALGANTIALVALMLLTPVAALISDRVGRKPMILAASISLALVSYPLFLWLHEGTFTRAVVGGLALAACVSCFSGCMAAAMAEQFPTRTRYSGVAIGYNAGMAIFGGTAPFVATALIKLTGDVASPGLYLAGCAVLAGVGCLFLKDRTGEPLG
jgi:MHS family proline/betaine transporter-like MFS transporter